MAKKGNRVQVILECTEHKESGMPGTSRYITTKNKIDVSMGPNSVCPDTIRNRKTSFL